MDVNSSAVLPPAAGIICRARLTNGLVNNEGKWLLPSGRGVQRKISHESNLLLIGSQHALCFSARAFRFTQDC